MIDTHCHLAHPDFDPDRDEVIARCWAGGVTAVLEIGYSVETSEQAIAIARAHPDRIRASVGIHPHEAGRAGDDDFARIRELSREPEVIAIGETGLDFYRDWAPRDRQIELFTKTVRFSLERDLPLVIHDRDAHDDILAILRDHGEGRARGVFHCFSGDRRVAEEAVGLGFYLGLGGAVTYWSPRKKGRLLAELPIDRIVLETDAPWLAPIPEKGTRNEPPKMTHVVARIAEARGMEPDEVIRRTSENAARLFAHAAPWPPRGA